MRNKYKVIDFSAGTSIESAVNMLNQHNELVCGSFNGHILYSDVDDMESAYKKITGKTKSECDAMKKAEHDRYLEDQRRHDESIPALTIEWLDKGRAVLAEKYHEKWEQVVPIRLSDMYRGMELRCCLDIVKALNDGADLESAKAMIEGQGHSGMSFGLVCSMVKAFCDRGDEFFSYVR